MVSLARVALPFEDIPAMGARTVNAFHEAAHAVAASTLNIRILGDVIIGPGGGCCGTQEPWWLSRTLPSEYNTRRSAIIRLAGIVAESMLDYRDWRDRECARGRQWSHWLRMQLRLHGALAAKGLSPDYNGLLECLPADRAHDESRWLWEVAVETRRLLKRNWPAVEAVRSALMKRSTGGRLSGDAVVNIAQEAGTQCGAWRGELEAVASRDGWRYRERKRLLGLLARVK